MTREALEPCLAEFDPAIHHGKKIVEGVDLSQKRDLTVKASIVETGSMDVEVVVEGKPEIVSKPTSDCWIEAWTPGDTVTARGLRDKGPYELLVRKGHPRPPPGHGIRLGNGPQDRAVDTQVQ